MFLMHKWSKSAEYGQHFFNSASSNMPVGYFVHIICTIVSHQNFASLAHWLGSLCTVLSGIQFLYKLQVSLGDDNVVLAALQTTVVGRGAHAYGTSPSNQRTESWWSFFHITYRHVSQHGSTRPVSAGTFAAD